MSIEEGLLHRELSNLGRDVDDNSQLVSKGGAMIDKSYFEDVGLAVGGYPFRQSKELYSEPYDSEILKKVSDMAGISLIDVSTKEPEEGIPDIGILIKKSDSSKGFSVTNPSSENERVLYYRRGDAIERVVVNPGDTVNIDSLSFSYDTGSGEFVVNSKVGVNVEYYSNEAVDALTSLKHWYQNPITTTS